MSTDYWKLTIHFGHNEKAGLVFNVADTSQEIIYRCHVQKEHVFNMFCVVKDINQLLKGVSYDVLIKKKEGQRVTEPDDFCKRWNDVAVRFLQNESN